MIQKKMESDVIEIEMVKNYPAAYYEIMEEAKSEVETGELPALKKSPPDMSSYDLILVGSPVLTSPAMGSRICF
jgi:hypothetical protein